MLGYFLWVDFDVQEIGVGHVIHDEMTPFIFYLEEDGPVFDYMLVFEFFYINEIFFQVEEMLLVELNSFNSQQFIIYFSVTFSDDSMGSFA